ncbi:MAG: flagellar biosynthesis anti-sigma factor FlgM [Candidatus Eremiobacteraeota bacterium]|nr:flagellar biosynthesis anti-sigma factor FlgM [Candidatus Eremiobacteraeota bacterium]MBV9408038.1 flagellar biosynthesis anti-sigma factor FlgM [Candidatus Eremiobacteraeota bacterium]
MIISRAEVASALSAYKTVKRKPSVASVAYDTADSFVRSEAAASIQTFVAAATAEPFYRADLVEDLRHRIAEGRYFVPTEEIVEKLLGRLIVNAAM